MYKELRLNELESLVRDVKDKEKLFSQNSIDVEWQRLSDSIENPNRKRIKRFYLNISYAAAVIALLIVSSYFFVFKQNISTNNESYASIADAFQEENEANEITLIIDGKTITTSKEKSVITYSKNGNVSIDNKKIGSEELSPDKKSVVDDYNCVIVPKGKQINLTLSDGTKLFVNSRSRLIYPKVFSAKQRELYVEGETYLEVAHNKKIPFVVKTINFNVEVLGTVFNVSSYKELKKSTITLVEGSVRVTDHNKNAVNLKPSQSVDFISGKLGLPEHTDVSLHTDWVHGYYIFNTTPLNEVLTKLSFYYDINFVCDKSIQNLLLSGKLDIRTDFENVLQNLHETAGVDFAKEGEKFLVTTSNPQSRAE